MTLIAVRLTCCELCWGFIGATEILGGVGFIFCTDDTTFSEKKKCFTAFGPNKVGVPILATQQH